MFAHSLRALIATATLALSCSAWQAPAVAHQPPASRPAFVSGGALGHGAGVRLRAATCSVRMVATGSSNDAPAGAVQSYMSKIPAHLQGLAIRNQKTETKDYAKVAKRGNEDDLLAIQAELDADEEDDMDELDYAMEMIDDLESPKMRTYDLDIKDAEILRNLKDNMHKEDFRTVFGRGVGELL